MTTKKTQIEKDNRGPGAPTWKRRPVALLPTLEADVGDVLIGEFAARGDGYWGAIDIGEVIRIRTAPLTDTPVVVAGMQMARDLREINPKIGDRLRIERLPDGTEGRADRRFDVRVLDDHDGHDDHGEDTDHHDDDDGLEAA